MNNQPTSSELDSVLQALGNQHRREIVYLLALQPYSISQLASLHGLSLPAIHKHIKILIDTGIIQEKKFGRTHFLAIRRDSLNSLKEWLTQFQAHWGNDSETLENYVEHMKEQSLRGGERTK